jgi:hypothetical protein
MKHDLIDSITSQTGLDSQKVREVIDLLCEHLHRGFYEGHGQNGDYVGGALSVDVGYHAFLHLIGVLKSIQRSYYPDEDVAWQEYANRIVPREYWAKFDTQINTWKPHD